MRENEIAPAAVNVERLTEVSRAHRRALDVPAGPPLPPWAVPDRLAGLARLPQSEIHRRLFPLVDFDARARFELVDILSRKLAVAGKALDRKVDVAVDAIGGALFFQTADERDDLGDMLGRLRLVRRRQKTQRAAVVLEFLDIFPRDRLGGRIFVARPLDDLVVHAGKVAHKERSEERRVG